MKVLFVSPVKPQEGSGIGPVEYAYQLEQHIGPLQKREFSIGNLYPEGSIGKYDIVSRAHSDAAFRKALRSIPKDEYDIIHITDHEIGFAARIVKGAGSKAKIVTTLHTLLRLNSRRGIGMEEKAYDRMVSRSTAEAVKYSDMLLCNSSLTCEALRKKFGPKRNVKTIAHGISDDFLKARIPKSRPKSVFNTGYLGPLYNFKNVTFVLNAAANLRDKGYRFYIYGRGPDMQFLKGFKRKNRLGNLELKGYVKEQEKVKVYSGMHAFAFPSLYEGLGMPIIEAQAMGLPVLIYKYGQIPREVRKYCIEVTTPENMAQVLRGLRQQGYSKSLAEAAAHYARGFTWEKAAMATAGVYGELAHR